MPDSAWSASDYFITSWFSSPTDSSCLRSSFGMNYCKLFFFVSETFTSAATLGVNLPPLSRRSHAAALSWPGKRDLGVRVIMKSANVTSCSFWITQGCCYESKLSLLLAIFIFFLFEVDNQGELKLILGRADLGNAVASCLWCSHRAVNEFLLLSRSLANILLHISKSRTFYSI